MEFYINSFYGKSQVYLATKAHLIPLPKDSVFRYNNYKSINVKSF